MKKIVKIAAIVVAVILAIALIAPIALKGKIADIVKREANAMLAAKLDFEKLDISLLRHFPNASLELKGLTLVGVDRFEGDTIVAARRISVVVNLMSLFGDSGFEVTKVILSVAGRACAQTGRRSRQLGRDETFGRGRGGDARRRAGRTLVVPDVGARFPDFGRRDPL